MFVASSRNLYLRKVRPYVRNDLKFLPWPKSWGEALRRLPWTATFLGLITALQLYAEWTSEGALLRDAGTFRPGQMNWGGFLGAAVFHASWGHFLANFLGVALVLAWEEVALGSLRAWFAGAVGFWLANPLTAWVLGFLLPGRISEADWQRFLAEADNGASNGIYSLVGVLAGCLFRPRTLVGPFLFNGLFYALVTREWLATQHVLALFGGLALTAVPGFLPKNQIVLQSMTKR